MTMSPIPLSACETPSRCLARDRRRLENRTMVRGLLLEVGCLLCGTRDEIVLQWHHVNPALKRFNVTSGLSKSERELRQEIDKCVILCANDHRRVEAGVSVLPGEYPDDDAYAFSHYHGRSIRHPRGC